MHALLFLFHQNGRRQILHLADLGGAWPSSETVFTLVTVDPLFSLFGRAQMQTGGLFGAALAGTLCAVAITASIRCHQKL